LYHNSEDNVYNVGRAACFQQSLGHSVPLNASVLRQTAHHALLMQQLNVDGVSIVMPKHVNHAFIKRLITGYLV
jgi:hypothetical protein